MSIALKDRTAADMSAVMPSLTTVYTDVAFAATRDRHYRVTARTCLALIAVNGIGWGIFGRQLGATAMSTVDFAFAGLGLLGLIASRWLALRATVHLAVLTAFGFVWSFIVVVEGIPGARLPIMNHWWFLAIGAGSLLLLSDAPRWRATYTSLAVASFLACELALVHVTPVALLPALSPVQLQVMSAGVHLSVFLGVLAVSGVFVASLANAERSLAAANDKLEALLANMLPRSIADRLRREGRTFADGYAECSVLFADLVGFTELAGRIPPERLVHLLDEIFSRFDDLTDRYGLEKIKTIGDSYMVAGGLPEARTDHAKACVALAIDMRAVVREYAGLQVRIGVNSGSVVAGVIGKRRFIYDLWGDAVNIASRMESHGVVDGIQISEQTARLVEDEYEVAPRGVIELKGKGALPTFLVVGRKLESVSPRERTA